MGPTLVARRAAVRVRSSEWLGGFLVSAPPGKPKANVPPVLLVRRAVTKEQVTVFGPTHVVPHRDVGKRKHDEKRRVHEEGYHLPQGEFPNRLRMTDLLVNPSVQRVVFLGQHGFFPGILYAAEHEVQRG